MNSNIIQRYVNNLRQKLTKYLKPNIGLQLKIFNCTNEGGMIVIYFKPGGRSNDIYISDHNKISEALGDLNQKFFGGDLSGLHFSGTNKLMDNEKIILIKDTNPTEWSDSMLNKDIKSIIAPPKKKGGLK